MDSETQVYRRSPHWGRIRWRFPGCGANSWRVHRASAFPRAGRPMGSGSSWFPWGMDGTRIWEWFRPITMIIYGNLLVVLEMVDCLLYSHYHYSIRFTSNLLSPVRRFDSLEPTKVNKWLGQLVDGVILRHLQGFNEGPQGMVHPYIQVICDVISDMANCHGLQGVFIIWTEGFFLRWYFWFTRTSSCCSLPQFWKCIPNTGVLRPSTHKGGDLFAPGGTNQQYLGLEKSWVTVTATVVWQ